MEYTLSKEEINNINNFINNLIYGNNQTNKRCSKES